MKCVILQPSYIPWRGYFHQIQKADVFVFYDDVQYDKEGWRNRNRILGPNGPMWLTIPVKVKNFPLIKDVEVESKVKWQGKHWKSLVGSYGKAPYFSKYIKYLEPYYNSSCHHLAEFTIDTTIEICRWLEIKTEFVRSSRMVCHGTKTERLIGILQELGATHYISGPAAKAYLDEEKLSEAGIALEYMEYNYPEYDQLYGEWEPKVSILDLIFMTGDRAPEYIWA